jgi:mono/diheme cytochrome c family protein
MSEPAQPAIPLSADQPRPQTDRSAVPVWLIVLFFVLLYWGMVYFDEQSGWFQPEVYLPFRSVEQLALYQPPVGDRAIIDHGKAVYDTVCALCHNPDGMGKPNQAPPLAGSEWVQGSPNRLIRIPLYGLSGTVTVKGQPMNFPAPMPNIGSALPGGADDVAAVLSYMRQAWGNKGSVITPEQVKAVTAQVGNRAAFTPEELEQVPEK